MLLKRYQAGDITQEIMDFSTLSAEFVNPLDIFYFPVFQYILVLAI